MKGQVSTEYLVILAIVLVVALVVVYLVGGFAGMGVGTMETQSMQAWGTAAPFAITSWKQTDTALEMEVQNNDVDQLTLTGIAMDGASVTIAPVNQTFASGSKFLITATVASACGAPGTSFSHSNVILTYNKGSISGKTETGIRPIVGKCS
ncbi:class III signal peptide-containing protein [Candidatus Micrarchaeota archaeon]|nr:class III signal peptide-containing protein [Candidatus Micrarchaeota archaeon]